MSTYLPDKDISHRKFYNYYQTVVIAFDIENIVLIAYVVSGREINLHIRSVFPFSFFSYIIPTFKGYTGILVSFRPVELFQFLIYPFRIPP